MTGLKRIEIIFEAFLWRFRLFTLLPVIFGLLSTLNFFVMGSIEVSKGLLYGLSLKSSDEHTEDVVGKIIGGVDYYLIGVVLLIFSFGIYELFISPIDIRFRYREIKILQISTLDQLKHKILQVIVMVLVVSFFKKVLDMKTNTPLDMLYFALAILVIAISSYLMHLQSHSGHNQHHEPETKRLDAER
jgi:uncharacterized membrane protein YqhA